MIGASVVVRISKPLGEKLEGCLEMVSGWLVPAYTAVSGSMSGDMRYMRADWMHGMQVHPGHTDVDLSVVIPEALGYDLDSQGGALSLAYQRVFVRRLLDLRFRTHLYVGYVDRSAMPSPHSQTGYGLQSAEELAHYYLRLS